MKIPEGEKVVILESGEIGILKYYDGSTAYIDVEGEEVQAHQKDIERASDFGYAVSKEKETETPVETQHPGIHLQCMAVHDMKGALQRFDLYVMNHTASQFFFSYTFHLNGHLHHQIKGTVMPGAVYRLHEFKTDQLNDSPVARIQLQSKPGIGEMEPIEKEIRLKTKTFFTRMESPEFLKSGYLLFEIFNPRNTAPTAQWPEAPESAFSFEKKQIIRHNEVQIKAEMPDFIDLHADTLLPGARFTDKNEILQHQLRHFRNFLEKAIRYNLHKIYAVHGIGKGILKAEIEKILADYPEVSSFNNDYQARFGFGATEIFLD